ncbi:MAG: hypothetical protein IT288_03960 [Bdellovibrionales bacterium]|nr:hypothetical protein [Bdellovibrionales bacterium]
MRFLLVALTLTLAFSATPSRADFLIEPFAGYETGEIKDNSSSSAAEDLKGMTYGLRLGLKMVGFGIGAEYTGGKLETDDTPSSEISLSNMGVFLSYDFPIMMRVYYSYLLSTDGEISSTPASTGKGTGYRLGVGLTSIPFVTINLEYLVRNWDEMEIGSLKTDIDWTVKTYMLSLAFPLTF